MTRSRKGAELLTAYESGGLSQFKNRIINGAMMIDQRNAGAIINSGSLVYSLDRWMIHEQSSGAFTIQRSTTAPVGFVNSAVITVTTPQSSLGAADQYFLTQAIEGFNVADLGFGTASASPVTVSFWVRSSVTGTYPVSIITGTSNRSYIATYTINTANTWEYKTATIPGDTTGTWPVDNSAGMYVRFSIGAGSNFVDSANTWVGGYRIATSNSTNLMATNGATFYITGVQLEKGSTATSFDYRPYGTELALCQRYYFRLTGSLQVGAAIGNSTTGARHYAYFPVPMRTAPSALEQSGTASDYGLIVSGSTTNCSSVPTINGASVNLAQTFFTVASGLAANSAYVANLVNANAYLGWSAEL